MVQLTKEWKGLVDADTGTVSREIFWSKDLYDQEMEQTAGRFSNVPMRTNLSNSY